MKNNLINLVFSNDIQWQIVASKRGRKTQKGFITIQTYQLNPGNTTGNRYFCYDFVFGDKIQELAKLQKGHKFVLMAGTDKVGNKYLNFKFNDIDTNKPHLTIYKDRRSRISVNSIDFSLDPYLNKELDCTYYAATDSWIVSLNAENSAQN